MRIVHTVMPMFVAAIVFASTAAAWMAPVPSPAWRTIAFGAAMAVAALSVTLGMPFIARRGAWPVRDVHRIVASSVAFIVSAFGELLIVEGEFARIAIAIAAAAFCFAMCTRLTAFGGPVSARHADIAALSFAMHALTAFFILSVAFRIDEYLDVPLVVIAAAAGAACGVLAWETLWRSAAESSGDALPGSIIGVMMAQFVAAMSLLPASAAVNASVGVVLFGLMLHAAGAAALAPRASVRRDLAFASTLLAVVLGTARWN